MRTYHPSQFTLLEQLGKGSFGVVYRAHDKIANCDVAIKQIDLELSDEDIHEIQKEISILLTCNFPQIVRYHGCYVNNYKLLIIMELLNGGSCLDMLVQIEQFQEKEIAIICRELLKALSYLHANNKIHRDIKAANVLVDDSTGDVKVVDFGVATQLSNNMSRRNTFVGTPFWMSPEVILQHDYNYKTDIWSLGITAIELALGKPPLANIHPLKVLFLIPKNPAPQLPQKNPRTGEVYSKDFQNFIKLCLQKSSALRPTAKQLLSHPFITGAGKNSDLLRAVQAAKHAALRAGSARAEKTTLKKTAIREQSPKNTACISFDLDDSTIKKTVPSRAPSRSSSGLLQESILLKNPSKNSSPISTLLGLSPKKQSRSALPQKARHSRSRSSPVTPQHSKGPRSFQSSSKMPGLGRNNSKASLFDFELCDSALESPMVSSRKLPMQAQLNRACNEAMAGQSSFSGPKIAQLNSFLCGFEDREIPALCGYLNGLLRGLESGRSESKEGAELYQKIMSKPQRPGDEVEELLLSRWAEGVLERWQ